MNLQVYDAERGRRHIYPIWTVFCLVIQTLDLFARRSPATTTTTMKKRRRTTHNVVVNTTRIEIPDDSSVRIPEASTEAVRITSLHETRDGRLGQRVRYRVFEGVADSNVVGGDASEYLQDGSSGQTRSGFGEGDAELGGGDDGVGVRNDDNSNDGPSKAKRQRVSLATSYEDCFG